ncbi:MAG TPA: DegV family protein [Acidimicrobiales bacterium]|nr:DegV family protein [Acidimicrobiales bacterium]
MAGVRVVTDSACDLSDELADRYGVDVVPLTIRFGGEELLDRRDLSPTEFWARCKSSPTLPETAAPPPGAFASAYERAATGGAEGIVCLTLSAGVSSTYQAALAGAESFGGRVPVEVVDTRSLTMGQGLMCIAAAELAATGASLEQVTALVRDLVTRTRVLGVVDTLDHLQRGGRIGGAAALVGSLLSIKPVIEVRDGVVEQESKQRTRGRALDYLAAKVAADAPLLRLAVCDGAAPDIDAIVGRLRRIEVAHDLVVTDLGPIVGAHSGPGSVGVCYELRLPSLARTTRR